MSVSDDSFPYNPELDPKYGYLVVGLSCISWFFVRKAISYHGLPTTVKQSDLWRWQNLAISWIHALVSGTWVLYCFIAYPQMSRDLIHFSNYSMYMLLAVSTGYFVYDQLDILFSKKLASNWEVSLHHVAVLAVFFYHLHYSHIIGYTIIALLTEVSSIFLHLRKLLLMMQLAYHWIYRVVAVVNIVTFVVFRGLAIGMIIYAILFLSHFITASYYVVLCISTFIMSGINPVLFWRLLKSDFIKKRRKVDSKGIVMQNGFSNNNVKMNHEHAN